MELGNCDSVDTYQVIVRFKSKHGREDQGRHYPSTNSVHQYYYSLISIYSYLGKVALRLSAARNTMSATEHCTYHVGLSVLALLRCYASTNVRRRMLMLPGTGLCEVNPFHAWRIIHVVPHHHTHGPQVSRDGLNQRMAPETCLVSGSQPDSQGFSSSLSRRPHAGCCHVGDRRSPLGAAVPYARLRREEFVTPRGSTCRIWAPALLPNRLGLRTRRR